MALIKAHLPFTSLRMAEHTANRVNATIRRCTETSVQRYARHPAALHRRLAELDREWDIERPLLATTADQRFVALPAAVVGFILQHAQQGWCRPLPILRRLGFRTQTQIHDERDALKALRGDFDQVPNDAETLRANAALDAVRR